MIQISKRNIPYKQKHLAGYFFWQTKFVHLPRRKSGWNSAVLISAFYELGHDFIYVILTELNLMEID